MIQPSSFFEELKDRGIGFFTGVPDSLLADLCAYIDEEVGRDQHLIAANEGNAVAIAIGYHISTNKVAMVYMQNSGLGNSVNPLTSLADPEVYKIPMLLVIGWRGKPGNKDEPQHIKQGRITLEQLDLLEIPYYILDASCDISFILDKAFVNMRQRNRPVALVVCKDTFAKYKTKKTIAQHSLLAREDALEQLLKFCHDDDLIVTTTGKTSREVFDLRIKHGQKQRDFLTVGGMGHASSIALGVAIGQPHRRVICIDGDGSLLMHMGSMPVIAGYKPQHFIHVLLNNASHESVGGQPTSAGFMNFAMLSEAVGYVDYAEAKNLSALKKAWQVLSVKDGPVLLEVKIKNGSRDDLGRPTTTAEQNKFAFMKAVGL
jgi:phosphonopyruvate decarboxylase